MVREVKIGQSTNVDVYYGMQKLVGRVKEFKLDKIGYESVTHEALGMVGKVDLPGRAMEALKATINFAWLDAELMPEFALPNRARTLTFEKFVDVFDAGGLVVEAGYCLTTTVDLLFREEAMDAFKLGKDSMGHELDCSVTRLVVKASHNAAPIREYVPFANINRVNGDDVWPRY